MSNRIKLYIKNNLVYYPTGNVVGVGLADRIAEANGFIYAEQFVRRYANQIVELDDNMEVVE